LLEKSFGEYFERLDNKLQLYNSIAGVYYLRKQLKTDTKQNKF